MRADACRLLEVVRSASCAVSGAPRTVAAIDTTLFAYPSGIIRKIATYSATGNTGIAKEIGATIARETGRKSGHGSRAGTAASKTHA